MSITRVTDPSSPHSGGFSALLILVITFSRGGQLAKNIFSDIFGENQQSARSERHEHCSESYGGRV